MTSGNLRATFAVIALMVFASTILFQSKTLPVDYSALPAQESWDIEIG